MIQLFEGPRVRLAPPDPEKDAEIESAWTHDGEYLRLVDLGPARPLSPWQVKKKYEQLEKEAEKNFYFAVRRRDDKPADGPEGPGRLIGFVRLDRVDWMHGNAELSLGLGAPADRGQGLGSEVLGLMLRYAFEELGLHRVAATTAAYNTGALRFFERHGFTPEVRRRQAVARDGQRWDVVMVGLLRAEWEARQAAVGAAEPAAATQPAPSANGAQGG